MAQTIVRQGSKLMPICFNCKNCLTRRLSTSRLTAFSKHDQFCSHKFQSVLTNLSKGCRTYCNESKMKRERPVVTNTLDEEEIKTFEALAQSWWNETGEFEALHAMNKLRIPFIRDGLLGQRDDMPEDPSLPLQGLKIVDAGCGGGIIAEPLARLGAVVVGVDPVEESTKIAQLHLSHDPAIQSRVKYITGTIEDLVVTEAETFDAVIASEVVEHVADLVLFVETCCKLIKPGGSVFFTTMNKTQMSKGLAVFAAEKVFRVVPEGTHDWEKFVPPEDLQTILENNGVDIRKIHGMLFNPVSREWSWMEETSINYALHGVKHDIDLENTDWSTAQGEESQDQMENTETQSTDQQRPAGST